ncbi:MAG: tripartite tricarboxylate transporter TctB family protein [Gammaproteobacteria bacterium]|nr:tripartite tricarboxylate transporter TctB family protein [Gammaproteobacteria bacterium]
MINLKNTEHASAFGALIVAGVFAFLSYYNTDAETYLFPRIIAVVLALMAIALFITNSTSRDDNRESSGYFAAVWPGMLVGLAFLLVMEDLGFYVSSFLAFLAILVFYGERPVTDIKALIPKSLTALGFMVILYLLFWQGLNVRTPTGILF